MPKIPDGNLKINSWIGGLRSCRLYDSFCTKLLTYAATHFILHPYKRIVGLTWLTFWSQVVSEGMLSKYSLVQWQNKCSFNTYYNWSFLLCKDLTAHVLRIHRPPELNKQARGHLLLAPWLASGDAEASATVFAKSRWTASALVLACSCRHARVQRKIKEWIRLARNINVHVYLGFNKEAFRRNKQRCIAGFLCMDSCHQWLLGAILLSSCSLIVRVQRKRRSNILYNHHWRGTMEPTTWHAS